MPKKKTGRRGGSGSFGSPRAKQGEEPVTDSVMQVIARRVRNARKKLQKVSHIEGLVEDGENLNEDQVEIPSSYCRDRVCDRSGCIEQRSH